MCQWTTDSQRLILEHLDMISSSPSYIYDFALPISPSSSWLHQYYKTEFSQEIRVVKGGPAEWGMCFHTVLLDDRSEVLTCWKDTIAVGLHTRSIVILNAITGIKVAIHSGHTSWVRSLVFSPDGTSLVSGSDDNTIKLWDMQTGGVVKTFWGHRGFVVSVSISADCTTIASGSDDQTIRLWDIQTGECHHIIQQYSVRSYVYFSPLDPKLLIFSSGGKSRQWDIDGQRIVSESDGPHIASSQDGAQFVVCNKSVVTVQSSNSREIVAKFPMPKKGIRCCCFSPDNRIIAAAAGITVYIWDITSSDPHPLETFIGHAINVSSLAFSSSFLISTSQDKSVKFWQIGASSTHPVPADPNSMPLASAPVKSIALQAKDGIAISNHSDGMVRVWDILTGLCEISFQTPAKDSNWIDTHLTDGRLISVWCTDKKICIWDTEKGELLRAVHTVNAPGDNYDSDGGIKDLRISGDGSKVFCLYKNSIQAWSIWTGEVEGRVMHGSGPPPDPLLVIDGLKVWVHFPISKSTMEWDFGALGSSPVKLSNMPQNGTHLDFIGGIRMWRSFLPGVQDTVTGRVVFQLPERLARCSDAQWDGQYLVAGYNSGEVLILECNHVLD